MKQSKRLTPFLRMRWVRVIALCAIVLALAIHISRQIGIQPAQAQVTASWSSLPPQGVAPNDTGGKILGNVNNGIDDLAHIYKMIETYHQRKGAYPSNIGDLFMDIDQESSAYGFSRLEDANQYFVNPDDRFADSMVNRKMKNVCLYMVSNKRPDGSLIGGPKIAGQRDVLAYTNKYIHHNVRYFKGQRSTENPVGVYLVLWDDGQVEQIPYDHQLFVPTGKNGGKQFANAFPGQAGTPDNSLTYDEFYRRLGWKNGPRGSEGSKGQSYNGRLPR